MTSFGQGTRDSDFFDRNREAVRTELSQVIERATVEAKAARGRASAWSRLYFVIGLPAAILAAVAGATALASTTGRVAAGIIALVAAALTTAATFLDSSTRQTSYENLAAGWQVVANDAELKLVVDIENDDWLVQDSRTQLQDLANRQRKLLLGKAPDAEAEAERRAENEAIRAQGEAKRARSAEQAARENAARAETEAERARSAEQEAKLNLEQAIKGRVLAATIQADAAMSVRDDGRLEKL
jgi:hypothetical protein